MRPTLPTSACLPAAWLSLAACGPSTEPPVEDATANADDATAEPEPNPFSGRSYLLDLSSVRHIEPEDGVTLLTLLAGEYLLLNVAGGEGTVIDMAVARAAADGESVTQDPCSPVVEMPEGVYGTGDLSVSAGPAEVAVWVDPGIGVDIELVLHAFTLSGVFAASGTSIDGVSFQATLDLREQQQVLDDLIGEGFDICDFLPVYAGFACAPCDDGVPACVNLDAATDSMAEWGGTFSLDPEEPVEGC